MAGGKADEATCKSREHAEASRIDGILANIDEVSLIHKVYVIQDCNTPTHSAVGVVISRNAMKESHDYATTLHSLRILYERKLEEKCKELEDKEREEHRQDLEAGNPGKYGQVFQRKGGGFW